MWRPVLLFLSLTSTAFATSLLCNGYAELCDRKYSNVTYIGTHDSPFNGNLPADNQNQDVLGQLNSGVRFLQGQIHKIQGFPRFCHTSCAERDAGPVQDYLTKVKSFLDHNPTEVISMLWTNPDRFTVNDLNQLFIATGADQYVFKPTSSPLSLDEWPTLGEMIFSGQRLVMFLDSMADHTQVPYFMDEFQYMWEDAYDQTDAAFNECDIDRANHAHPDGKANILVPDRQHAARTNAAKGAGSVGAHGDLCASIWERYPNFILVDFVDKGNPLDAAKAMNRLS